MAQVIATTVQKGGVAKSTTAKEVGACLAEMKKRVLLIDTDPSRNLSRNLGANFDTVTIYDVLTGDVETVDAIQAVRPNLDIIISDKQLGEASHDFSDEDDIYRLSAALLPVRDQYDFIIIDTPPSVGMMPSMALCAADYVLIPSWATSECAQGIGQLHESIQEIQKKNNPEMKIIGIVITMFNGRTIFNSNMGKDIEQIAKAIGTKVLKTRIRNAVVVQEANGFAQTLSEYAPKSKPANDYRALTKEILKELK